MQATRHDMALLKQDLLKVLRRAFKDDSPQLEELAELMLPEPGQLLTGPYFLMPQGKNVYSLLYTVQMTLKGDRLVRGRDVREAKQNLMQELTQELSIRELVAQSTVMPICPVEHIEIKEPELVHGIEPGFGYVPRCYMPKETELMLEMDSLLEQLSVAIDSPKPISEQKGAAILQAIKELNEKSRALRCNGLDLDEGTIERMQEAIRQNPEKASRLMLDWEGDQAPALIRETLDEIEE